MSSPDRNAETMALIGSKYPGRGVFIALNFSGSTWYLGSHTGGRSEGSLNRIYRKIDHHDGPRIGTDVYDHSKQVGDPASTLYIAHANSLDWHVASNGAQTVDIAQALANMEPLRTAQFNWENEGPKGSYTSRISAAVRPSPLLNIAFMGKVIQSPFNRDNSNRYEYILDFEPGTGYYLPTYDGKGETDPYLGDPAPFKVEVSTAEDLSDVFWDTLNPETRGSLVIKSIRKSNTYVGYTAIKNRHTEAE